MEAGWDKKKEQIGKGAKCQILALAMKRHCAKLFKCERKSSRYTLNLLTKKCAKTKKPKNWITNEK